RVLEAVRGGDRHAGADERRGAAEASAVEQRAGRRVGARRRQLPADDLLLLGSDLGSLATCQREDHGPEDRLSAASSTHEEHLVRTATVKRGSVCVYYFIKAAGAG